MPHFFIFSSFSTATPRFLSSAVIDELLLLWCMLEPESRDQNTETSSQAINNKFEQTATSGRGVNVENPPPLKVPSHRAWLNSPVLRICLKYSVPCPSPLRQTKRRNETVNWRLQRFFELTKIKNIFEVAAEGFLLHTLAAFLILCSFPVPGYSFDWLVLRQKKELLGGTLLLLAIIRSSVAGWGLDLYWGL